MIRYDPIRQLNVSFLPEVGGGGGIAAATVATSSTDVYAKVSLMLSPSGYERSVIRRHSPVLWRFSITPNRLM